MENVSIITLKRLSNHYIKEYNFIDEKRITIEGYCIKGRKMQEKADANSLHMYMYHSDSDAAQKLKKGIPVNVGGENAYFFKPFNPLLVIILFLLILLALLAWLRKTPDAIPENPFDFIGEEKEDPDTEMPDNIIYQGFPSEFEINSKVKYLSVQNDPANEGKFYTGVRLEENGTEIYNMGKELIEPGKYVNIDLYELLDAGEHKVKIIQYGYSFGDNISQVASEPGQTVTITVKK